MYRYQHVWLRTLAQPMHPCMCTDGMGPGMISLLTARPCLPFPISAVEVLELAPPLREDGLKTALGSKVLLVGLQVTAELLHTRCQPGDLVLRRASVVLRPRELWQLGEVDVLEVLV